MSYDIYGNPLRRGHCEVHPHVHEEYPCSVCIQENENRNSQQQSECDYYKIASLEHGLDLSQQRIAELEQRNGELAATVERLLKVCELALDSYGKVLMTDLPQEAWKANQVTAKLVEAIAATPKQNLNAMKREVYADGYYDGYRMAWLHDHDSKADHDEYASEQSEIEAEKLYPSVKDGEQ